MSLHHPHLCDRRPTTTQLILQQCLTMPLTFWVQCALHASVKGCRTRWRWESSRLRRARSRRM